MWGFFLALTFVFASFSVVHSQTPCELAQQYSEYLCKGDTVSALATIEKYYQLYPKDYLDGEWELDLAKAQYGKGYISIAKQLIIQLIHRKPDNPYKNPMDCPLNVDSACWTRINSNNDFREIQYSAAMLLYEIYTHQKRFDSALYVLQLAYKEFPGGTCRGCLPNSWRSDILLKFSTTYENLHDVDNAINVLVPHIRTEPVDLKLVYLLKKYRNIDSLRQVLTSIRTSLVIEYGVVSENPQVKYDCAEDGRILRTTSIEEYGRITYWYFLGQKFIVSKSNDYKSFKMKGERRKRKLYPVISDEQLLVEAEQYIKSLTVYKRIME